MQTEGKFGTILVTDGTKSRRLYINGELQGGAYFVPGADTVDPALSGPGPVSEAKYALGWLIAGKLNPRGSLVMVGLGSGAGVTQLLANFPDVDITVIEIDPAIIAVASKCYPLLDYYADLGRLNIVEADAREYLEASDSRWDAGLADAYAGKGYDMETHYFPQLCRRCMSLYVNVISKFAGENFLKLIELMEEGGHPVSAFFQPNQMADGGINTKVESNWLLASDDLDISDLQGWQPFPQYTEEAVGEVRRYWKQMLATGIVID